MDSLSRSSVAPPTRTSERGMRGSVLDRESVLVDIFGEALSKLGFEGDFNGVFSSSLTIEMTDGRRGTLYLLVMLERVESDLLERLHKPISPSSDIPAMGG